MERRKKKSSDGPAYNWMNTYGDLVTLLLTFFVLLFSFSTINEEKWRNLVLAFTGGTGGGVSIIPGDGVPNSTKTPDPSAPATSTVKPSPTPDGTPAASGFPSNIDSIYKGIIGFIKNNGLDANVEVSKTDLEIIIRFKDNIMFDSGKANLKPEFYSVLDKFTDVLDEFEDEIEMIRIEGHTDNRPINTKEFPSNWELSTARAVEVLRYLIEIKHFSTDKISAVGYGEYHPIDTNETAEGRARNRRVVFVITRSANITND